MTTSQMPQNPQLVPYLYVLNRLVVKASAAKTREELIFLIVNDTIHLLPYNRAFLFSFEEAQPKIIGISGEASVNHDSPLIKSVEHLVAELKDPKEAVVFNAAAFNSDQRWTEYQKQSPSSVFWLPIFSKRNQVLGLWLEQMESSSFVIPIQEMLILLKEFLMHAYGIGWERLSPKFSVRNWMGLKGKKALLLIPILIGLACIPIPLRVAAPCEVISKTPYAIRAPLNGVVKELLVLPGQIVKKRDPLLVYDPKVLQHALKSAQEDVLEKKLEYERSALLGMQNKQPLSDLGLLQIKLQKEKVNLALAEYEASLLTLKSPQEGVVILESPDDWRGHPVSLGEKIMTISDPVNTRIKIWIPESDNIPLDITKPIKVYLNIFPSKSYPSKIEYIANEVSMSERDVPSFVAKADWIDLPPKDVKLGLRGTAIIYGESVPLFYYIIRKPWFTLRNFVRF